MKIRILALALAILALLSLPACGKKEREPKDPPDLRGEWVQDSEAYYYQVATITDDTIEVFWYLTADGSKKLYWSGTYAPPETGEEPYVWKSENNLSRALTSPWALRDETKTFTYKDGKLIYSVMQGRLRMTAALVRRE